MQPNFSTRLIVRHQEIIHAVYALTDYQYNLQALIIFSLRALVRQLSCLGLRAPRHCVDGGLSITPGGGRLGSKVPGGPSDLSMAKRMFPHFSKGTSNKTAFW